MPPNIKQADTKALDRLLLNLMSELAGYLVAAGVSYPRFDGLVRVAFYRAASGRAKLRNRRLNQSALAAMTGLTRVQVRQFARQSEPGPPTPRDRIDGVIEGWMFDSAFLTPSRTPRPLNAKGNSSAFAALVRKYGGDIPPRSVLRELERHGYVNYRRGIVTLKRSARQSREELRLTQLSRALLHLMKTPTPNATPASSLRTWSSEAIYPASSEKGRAILNKRILKNLHALVLAVKAMGVAASADSPPPDALVNRRTRTKIVMINEDVDP
jgi:hypothetical protein